MNSVKKGTNKSIGKMKSLENLWFKRLQPVLREAPLDERIMGHKRSKRIFEFVGNLFRLSRIKSIVDF